MISDMKLRTIIGILSVYVAVASVVSCSCRRNESLESESVIEYAQVGEQTGGYCLDSLRCVEGKVKSGQFFSTLLTSLGMSQQEAYNLTVACGQTFDVKTLRVGNSYKAYYDDNDILCLLVYDRDRTSQVLFNCMEPYEVAVREKPVEIVSRYAEVTIENSLWVDMRNAGVSSYLILDLSDIYAWTVDFFGLQKGDRFKVLYDEKVCDNEVVGIDTVRYAVFSRGDSDLPMVMFNQHDGGNIWWNEKGAKSKTFSLTP